ENPLLRFRAALMKYSDQVSTAPWDRDFPLEAEALFHRDVRPAVLAIEEAVRAKSYLQRLVSRYSKDPKAFLTPAAASLITPVLSVFTVDSHTFIQAVAIAWGLGHVGAVAWDVHNEAK